MATRSTEIEAILRDVVGSVERGDATRMDGLVSADPDALAIGTDAAEWAQGHEEIMRFFHDSGPDGSLRLHVPMHEVCAYAEGNVGWGHARVGFEVEGTEVPVRMTCVLHREDGAWRMVQMHASIAVPNESMMEPMFTGARSASR